MAQGLLFAAFPALELCSSWGHPPTCFISRRKRSPLGLCAVFQTNVCLSRAVNSPQPGTRGFTSVLPALLVHTGGADRVRGGGSGGQAARMRRLAGAGEAGGPACPRGFLSLVRPGDGPVSSRSSDQRGVPGAQETAQPRGRRAPLRTRGAAGRRAAGCPPTPGCLRTGTPRRPAARSAPAW